MANKILLMCMLIGMAGCDGDKQNPRPVTGCLALPMPPQIVVGVNNAHTGGQVLDAQVKINLVGNTGTKTYDAVYVEYTGGAGGTYIAMPDRYGENDQLNISITAKGFNSYQAKNKAFKNDPGCGADNTTRFTVALCPLDAACE